MAYDTTDLSLIYDTFLDKGIEKLVELQVSTGMEDENLASASSEIIAGAMVGAINAMEMLKRNELLDKQILTEITREKVLAQKYVGRKQ